VWREQVFNSRFHGWNGNHLDCFQGNRRRSSMDRWRNHCRSDGHMMTGPLLIITGLALAIYCGLLIYSGDKK